MAGGKMRTRRNVSNFRLGFEQLEGRRMLAADFAISAMADVEIAEPSQCQTAAAEFPVESDVQMDFAEDFTAEPSAELAAEIADPVDNAAGEAEAPAGEAETTMGEVESRWQPKLANPVHSGWIYRMAWMAILVR